MAQGAELLLHGIPLLLLPIQRAIERVDHILGEADLGLKFVQPGALAAQTLRLETPSPRARFLASMLCVFGT